MLSSMRRRNDTGFTLVELLIAILIMGTAISVLVVAMGSLTVASQQAKGSAVAEGLSHTFAEAIQDKVSYTTTLAAPGGLSAGATPSTITVSDAGGFKSTPTTARPMDILIDQEVFTVTKIAGNTLTLATDGNNGRGEAGTVAADHADGANVLQYFICPVATATSGTTSDGHVGYLTPDNFSFPQDSAGRTLATASIAEINYVDDQSAGTFTSANNVAACINNYADACFGGSFRPECDPGMQRVDIRVQTALANLQNVTTDGWIMVRRGSN